MNLRGFALRSFSLQPHSPTVVLWLQYDFFLPLICTKHTFVLLHEGEAEVENELSLKSDPVSLSLPAMITATCYWEEIKNHQM